MKLKTQDFYGTFFLKDSIPSVYEKIAYSYKKDIFHSSKNTSKTESNTLAYFNKLFPQYLTPSEINSDEYHIKKIEQSNLDGFGILINDDEKDIESFMLKNFKSSTRSPIKRRLKRLESCFSIDYKFFFGEQISEIEYDAIMDTLKEMLLRRFAQKDDINEVIEKWQHYKTHTHAQVIAKEASIYVIYANNNIVAISLNYHIKDILVGHIISYDIDYSKFSLGNTMVYKLLDWCIKNNYSILDMGNGEMEYKTIWCNYSYHYDYHFIYKKNALKAYLLAHKEVVKINIKNSLKRLKIIDFYRNIKSSVFGKNVPKATTNTIYTIEKINPNDFNLENLKKVNISEDTYSDLKKTIYDFLFLSKEHKSDIEIFEHENKDIVFIKGKNNIIKINKDN